MVRSILERRQLRWEPDEALGCYAVLRAVLIAAIFFLICLQMFGAKRWPV